MQRRHYARRQFGWALAAAFMLGALPFLTILIVDPYDTRPWGLAPVLADYNYPDNERAKLRRAFVAKRPDLILLGGSTVMAVTPQMLIQAFPNRTVPANLSYRRATPVDLLDTLNEFLPIGSVRQIIISLDYTGMRSDETLLEDATAADRLLHSGLLHMPDYELAAVLGSWNRVLTGRYDPPSWANSRISSVDGRVPMSRNPSEIRKLDAAVRAYSAAAATIGPPVRCGDYPLVHRYYRTMLRRAVAKGVQVDVVFPPNPAATYYVMMERRANSSTRFAPGAVLPQIMAFRRCVLEEAVQAGPLVSVHAPDMDPAFSYDLSLYRDPIHLFPPIGHDRLLWSVATGRSKVTLGGFALYEATILERVRRVKMAGRGANSQGEKP
ncbi:hypothetical protein [Sphingomonas hylomeconis]|uniref:SGNH/GDSL hydrolase family protein n=1 Tax=Sphingomonas hylomeconis TaxID=1395958 RepID=A0ABV7SZ31_9SPHN|nr:hypothetical protein [Sphingomonas hylomeconis]